MSNTSVDAGMTDDYEQPVNVARIVFLERFSLDVNREIKGVPRGAQIRFGLL
jgi:hypothetical protein